jgi:hypothetical protein
VKEVNGSVQDVRKQIETLGKQLEMKESATLVTVLNQFKEFMKKFLPEPGNEEEKKTGG